MTAAPPSEAHSVPLDWGGGNARVFSLNTLNPTIEPLRNVEHKGDGLPHFLRFRPINFTFDK